MFNKTFKPMCALLAAVVLSALPSSAAVSAVPGMLNYVEGKVTMAGQPVTANSIGSVQMEPNQVMETANGKAEILLTPGVFVRLGDHSALRMVSPNLGDTTIQLLRGEALVEADQIFKDSNLRVMLDDASTKLTKHGLFVFNANSGLVSVLDGKAVVEKNDQQVDLKKGRQVSLAGPLQAKHFDTKALEQQDQLYAWSKLRSEYDSEAAAQSASTIVVGGPGWWGPGWYWNPWWDMYSFVPGVGILYSPFGWPFYSPFVVYSAPIYRYGYAGPYRHGFAGREFAGRPAIGRGVVAPHAGGVAVAPHVSGGFGGRGFAGGFGGGGFHGGAGMHR